MKLRVYLGALMMLLILAAMPVYSQAADEQKPAEQTTPTLEERVQVLEQKAADADPLATKGFFFTGYARSGFLMNDKGGSTTNDNDGAGFRLPGAGSRWRLGNEWDTYAELGIGKDWKTDDGANFRVLFMPTYKEFNDRDWVEYGADSNSEAKLTLRQSYAEATNVFGGLSFWAGQRYYRRSDIHVIDFYYTHPVGLGGGVGDIPLGSSAKMAVAWLNSSRGNGLVLEDTGEFTANNLYVDFYNIGIGPGGLDIQASASWTSDGKISGPATCEEGIVDCGTTEYDVDSENGFNVTAQYGMGKFFGLGDGGFSKIFLQYGTGTSNDFFAGSAGLWSVGSWNNYTTNVGDAARFRAGAFGVFQKGNFEMMPAFVYEYYDNGNDENSNQTWYTIGLRPEYTINNHFSLQGDWGLDYVDMDGGPSGMMNKFSFAPTVKVGGGFWDRPEIRAFVTYATWDDEFEGMVGGSAYAKETSGFTYGFQFEAWW